MAPDGTRLKELGEWAFLFAVVAVLVGVCLVFLAAVMVLVVLGGVFMYVFVTNPLGAVGMVRQFMERVDVVAAEIGRLFAGWYIAYATELLSEWVTYQEAGLLAPFLDFGLFIMLLLPWLLAGYVLYHLKHGLATVFGSPGESETT